MRGKLNKSLTLNLWGSEVVLPEGEPVMLVVKGDGLKGDIWAVASVARLIELTGNSHDPKYRYAWIDAEHVTPNA